jgi:hypothetical protein
MHYGGPYLADDSNCPLRLTHKGPLSKSQHKAITQTQKAAYIRAYIGVNCSKADHIPTNTLMEGEPIGPTIPTPTTPTRTMSLALPVSTPPYRFRLVEPTNRCTPLLKFT